MGYQHVPEKKMTKTGQITLPQSADSHIPDNPKIPEFDLYCKIRCFLEKEILRHCCSIYCLTYQHVPEKNDKNWPNYLSLQIRIFQIIPKYQILTYIVYITCFLEKEIFTT